MMRTELSSSSGNKRFVHACTLVALQLGPRQEGSQSTSIGFDELAGLLDDEPQPPPNVAGPALQQRQLERAALSEQPLEELARLEPQSLVVTTPEIRKAVDDRVVDRQRRRRADAVVPSTARSHELEQFVVATAEQCAAQCRDDGDLVARIVDRLQRDQRLAHFLRVEHERARFGSIRDVGLTQRVLERRERQP